MDAAATVIGIPQKAPVEKRAPRRTRIQLQPGRGKSSGGGPGRCTLCATACASIALVVAGVVLLALSTRNEREQRVADFGRSVEVWAASARADFAAARFTVAAGVLASAALQPSNASDFELRDAEEGLGVEQYRPLKHRASLELPVAGLLPALSLEAGVWRAPFPGRSEAASVSFDFVALGSNGASSLGTLALPLAYGEAQPPITEYPEIDCRQLQHGLWQGRRCHTVKLLKGICLQVEPDGGGGWRLVPNEVNSTGRDPWPPGPRGCDPLAQWAPAEYVKDLCGGARPGTPGCSAEERLQQHVEVTLRSVSDPFLRVEELTHDRFDFGPSAESQRTSGMVFVGVGCLLGLLPLLRCARPCLPSCCQEQEERQALSPTAARTRA